MMGQDPDGANPVAAGQPIADDHESPVRLRAQLVEQLRAEHSLHDDAVAHALAMVPRHLFLPGIPLQEAYANAAIPTHWEDGTAVSSASQPAIVAIMLEQLRLAPGMRVLEIGAGTGYNAALLATLVGPGGQVITVDIDPQIVAEAQAHLCDAGIQGVRVVTGDGSDGWPWGAPYDRIELTVGATDLSPAWAAQLADGGMLVLPLWLGTTDVSIALRKSGDRLLSESLAQCGFMRLRGREGDAQHWTTLPNGWRLVAAHAGALAAPVAHLLATRPRRRFGPRPLPPFLQYLALHDAPLVTLWPEGARKPQRQLRPRYGLFVTDADGPSLTLMGARPPILLSFGGHAADRRLDAEYAYWQSHPTPPIETWRVEAIPLAAAAAPPPEPGVLRVRRRHYAFDITVAP